jgi:DNA repair protein RecO (recombination protein O)
MSRYKIEAFIIRAIRMGESSRVVTFFSKELGKIKGVAKGVGRPKSRLGGKVELFNLIEGDFYKKETSDLGILSGAGLLEDFKGLSDNPRKFGFASAWCEVLDKTSHAEEPHPQTFNLTLDFFKILQAVTSESSGLLFWAAMMRLLAFEGYAPSLDACISCGRKLPSGKMSISLSRGGLVCQDCSELEEPAVAISEPALKLLREMMAKLPSQIVQLKIDKKTGKKAADVILSLASYHLGLPRNLKSFKFLDNLAGPRRQ